MIASWLLSNERPQADQARRGRRSDRPGRRSDRPGSRRRFRDSRPPKPLTFGALAIAHFQANAVGPVRLTCEPRALKIDLLRVGRFASGFAPAGLADEVSYRVPYRAVRGMVVRDQILHLSLDGHAATPYNRFALVRFSRGPHAALMRVFRLRALAQGLGFVLPPVLAAVVAAGLPDSLAPGIAGRTAVGLLVLVALWRGFRSGVTWLTWGGPRSERLRAAFERAVSSQLGLELAPDLLAPSRLDPPAAAPEHLLGGAGRTRAFAAVLALAVGGSAAAAFTVKRYGVRQTRTVTLIEAERGLELPAGRMAAAAIVEGTPVHERCTCGRPYLGFWARGFPELSIVMTPVVGGIERLWVDLDEDVPVLSVTDRGIELDLAVVNNGARTFDTIDLVATFAQRDDRGRRHDLIERGLHWPGKLRPGESIKWRVEASGAEVKVEGRYDERLGAEIDPADPDALWELRDARLPLVRLHAAVMLGWLGDPRGQELARRLGPLPPAGEAIRRQLLAAAAPLRVCDAVPVEGGLEACVFNGEKQLHRALVVTEDDATRHELRDLFEAGKGLRFVLPIDALPASLTVTPP